MLLHLCILVMDMRRCSIQRIAKRSRYLTAERCELLDSIGFDWTGADALS